MNRVRQGNASDRHNAIKYIPTSCTEHVSHGGIMPGKSTIRDIAKLAGVSTATISRVLNNKPDVDPATRERVLRIVEEQQFVPSITASGLPNGRSRLIGVLIPDLTWPLIPELMRGIGEVVGSTSYELILYSIYRCQSRERPQ